MVDRWMGDGKSQSGDDMWLLILSSFEPTGESYAFKNLKRTTTSGSTRLQACMCGLIFGKFW